MRATEHAAAYLGREELLERLVDVVAAVAAGSGRLCILRGPAGSGTTHTAAWVAEHAASQGFAVRRGSFAEGLHDRPYAALAGVIEAHARDVPAATLADELDSAGPPLARVAPALRDKLPGIPPPAPLDAFDERLRLFDGYAAWLGRAAANRPVLLVLDDLQWADMDVVELLRYLLPRLARAPALLLASWADQRGAPKPAATSLLEGATLFELGGLDKGAVGALLARDAGRPVSAAALDLIQQISGGQPLPAIELYRHLVEEGHVGRPGGDQLPAADDLPRRLDDIVAWRVAALSPESRSALAALACFPEGALISALASVAGLNRPRLVQALDEPLRRGLVTSVERSDRYALPHHGVRRALLATMDAAMLARALRRAAEAIEVEAGPDARQIAALLAELYTHSAAEPGGAAGLRHCLVAAEQARAAAAHVRAADLLAAALELLPASDSTARADLQRRLLQARAEAGQAQPAVSLAQRLMAPVRGGSPDITPLSDAARALRAWGATTEAATLVELGRTVLAARGGDRKSIESARLELLAESWQPAGDDVQATVWQQVDDLSERLLLRDGDETDRADLFGPQRQRTHEQTVALLTLSRAWRRPSALLGALRGACTDLSTRLGHHREAASWAAQYLAAAERYGSLRDTCRALLFASRCDALLGNLDAAADQLSRADDAIERTRLDDAGDPDELDDHALLARLTIAHYRDGDWHTLADAAASRLAERARPAGLLLTAEAALGRTRIGDEGSARPLALAVVDAAERWPPLAYLRDEALLVALTAAWELGWAIHIVRGRTLVEHAQAAGAGGNHAATPGLALARLSSLAGRVDDARAAFATQRATLQESGLRPLRAILDHDEAVCLAAAGVELGAATDLLRAAAKGFAGLGMDGWLARTERLLDGGFEPATRPGGRLHFTFPAGLSRREVDVVRLLADGTPLGDIAAMLEMDLATAERHLESALAKLGADDASDLPRLARRHGLGGGV